MTHKEAITTNSRAPYVHIIRDTTRNNTKNRIKKAEKKIGVVILGGGAATDAGVCADLIAPISYLYFVSCSLPRRKQKDN